MTKSRI